MVGDARVVVGGEEIDADTLVLAAGTFGSGAAAVSAILGIVPEESATPDLLVGAFARALGAGWDFVRIPRDDTAWAAYAEAFTPLLASEYVYEDDIVPDHAGEVFRGLDGLRRAWTIWTDPFEEMVYDLERIVGSGDQLVSIHRVRTTARRTGIVQDFRIAYVWTFRAGRLIHQRGFLEAERA